MKKYMNRTEYAIKLIKIWNSSRSRQEAFSSIQRELDAEILYSQVLNKITYARNCGVFVEDLEWDITNWSKVKDHFGDVPKAPAFEIE